MADSFGVAMINGLDYDRHQEEIEVRTFAAALRASIDEFQTDPSAPALVPNWSRVWAGVHDAGPQFLAAVREGPA